jgi:hypothetical protein
VVGMVFAYAFSGLKPGSIIMRFFAFCPMNMSQSDASELALDSLKEGHVVVVSKSNTRTVPFRGARADSYGYDLYLVQVDADQTETLVSSGGFN